MFNPFFVSLLQRLAAHPRAQHIAEYHGPCEETFVSRLGPLTITVSYCLVLDHRDAEVTLPLGPLALTGRWTVGTEPIRPTELTLERRRQ